MAPRQPGEEPEVRDLLGQLHCLADRGFTVEELPGGLTNRNMKVTAGESRLVVRICSRAAGLLSIDRDDEFYNSSVAARTGVGAPVIEYRPDLGVLVVGFLDARTCTAADLTDGDRLGRVAAACRRLHDGPRFRNHFDMFALQRHYLGIVRRRGFRVPPGYLQFLPYSRRIETVIRASGEAIVPCHNDLLAGNCLDDGERVWLIDYEYSGNNYPSFELGNLWSESALTLDHLDELLTSYYGRISARDVARARLQGLMSNYGWTLWACIQSAVAAIDFDFWSWGMGKYDRACSEFTGAAFEGLLDSAAEP